MSKTALAVPFALPIHTSSGIPLETLLTPGVILRAEVPRKKGGTKQVVAMTLGGFIYDDAEASLKFAKAIQKAIAKGKALPEKWAPLVNEIKLVAMTLPVELAVDAGRAVQRGELQSEKARGKLRSLLLAPQKEIVFTAGEVQAVIYDSVTSLAANCLRKAAEETEKTASSDNQPAA